MAHCQMGVCRVQTSEAASVIVVPWKEAFEDMQWDDVVPHTGVYLTQIRASCCFLAFAGMECCKKCRPLLALGLHQCIRHWLKSHPGLLTCLGACYYCTHSFPQWWCHSQTQHSQTKHQCYWSSSCFHHGISALTSTILLHPVLKWCGGIVMALWLSVAGLPAAATPHVMHRETDTLWCATLTFILQRLMAFSLVSRA